MIIHSFQGGFDKNLSYLIWCKKTNIAAIIDPAVEINPMIELINKYDLILEKIFITHTHHDHISHLNDYLYLFRFYVIINQILILNLKGSLMMKLLQWDKN